MRSIHEETVRGSAAWRAEGAAQLDALAERLRAAEEAQRRAEEAARNHDQRALHMVTTLTVDRETLQRKLDASVSLSFSHSPTRSIILNMSVVNHAQIL